MNFDVYEINKIFYDQIWKISSSRSRRFGFYSSGGWDNPTRGLNYLFNFDISRSYYWIHSPLSFNKRHYLAQHASYYKIYQNQFIRIGNYNYLHPLITGVDSHLSLRELILFMIYLKHLHSLCIK